MKRYLYPAICIIFIALLIIYPQTALSSSLKGVKLWLEIVLPSLFPFFVAAEILGETGFIRAMGKVFEPVMRPLFNVPGCGSFALAMGISSGYPAGAKITSDLREKGYITKTEAERLITFTNNSGPLFITGAVATGMLNSPNLGILLVICHLLGGLTVGFLFRFYKRSEKSCKKPDKPFFPGISSGKGQKQGRHHTNKTKPGFNFGTTIGNAVKNSMMTLLSIGGFIILFSVVINLLLETGIIISVANFLHVFLKHLGFSTDIVQALLSGILELTTGNNMASRAGGITDEFRLAAVSFITGWAGLSVHSQVMSIINKTDISIKPYLVGKLLHGIISSIYISIILNYIVPLEYLTSGYPGLEPALSVFSPEKPVTVIHMLPAVFSVSVVILAGVLAVYSIAGIILRRICKISRL